MTSTHVGDRELYKRQVSEMYMEGVHLIPDGIKGIPWDDLGFVFGTVSRDTN